MKNSLNKLLGLLLIIFGTFFIFKNNQDLNLLSLILLIIIFIFSIIIIFLPIIKINHIQKLPLLNLINIYFLICYLGVFFFDKNKIFYNKYVPIDYSNSILVLFIGYFFFHAGYFVLNIFLKKIDRQGIDFFTCDKNEILMFGTFVLSNVILFFYIIEIQTIFDFFSQLKYPLLLFGIGLCFHYIIDEKNNKIFIFLILSILISTPIIFELLSGSFNFPFMILFLLYVYYFVFNKKIKVIPFILISVIFLFIHLGKYDYRLKTWSEAEKNLNFYEKSKIFLNVYFSNQTKDLKFDNLIKRSDNFRLERRIFHSYWSLIIVTKETPNKISYWSGYSYKILSSKLIPRIFWKEKPSDTLGNEFGHRYNVLTKKSENTKRDNSTSWNMPVLNEFYVNFGKYGVVAGMFLIGLIINFITRIFSINKNRNVEYIISFYLFIPLFFMESHLSLLFGALIQSYIFLIIFSFIILFLLRKIK